LKLEDAVNEHGILAH